MITTEAPPPAPAKPSRNEGLKSANPLLTGTILQTLNDPTADHFSDDDYEFLKFHGAYQQDDRDKRKTGKQYSLMVRTKFPGGVLSAKQYAVCDQLASDYGNNTLRITTRQDFQFHGVLKSNLRQTIKGLNDALVTTIAACGDVQRNVVAPPTPATNGVGEAVLEQARLVSQVLGPRTPGYHAIWIEGKELDLNSPDNANFVDPLYGRTYLPRKFKVGFAIPPLNDVDIYTQDVGFVVISEGDRILGYNLVAGGGLGMSHNNPHTFPRLADLIGYLPADQVEAFSKAVLTVHRDFGDRTNRKHARLKYIIHERGVDWFRQEIEARAGHKLEPARPFQFTRQGDLLGWHEQANGKFFLGLFVENGRIRDQDGYQLKTALREIADRFGFEVRLTAAQNLLLVNVPADERDQVDQVLIARGVSPSNPFSRIRRASMACPALPTCGLALAESERTLPDLMTQLETLLAEFRLQDEEITVRMTGCPNGCARPYTAEIAFVGKAPNKYQIYLGGNEGSTRMNRLYKDSVKGDEIIQELRPVFLRFFQERLPAERFGDFCVRAVLS